MNIFRQFGKTGLLTNRLLAFIQRPAKMNFQLVSSPQYPSGYIEIKSIDDLIDDWHDGAGEGKTLREYLGLTVDQYRELVRGVMWRPDMPDDGLKEIFKIVPASEIVQGDYNG